MNPTELKIQLASLVGAYPHPQAALVPALNLLRDQGSSLTDELVAVLADVCGVETRQIAELLAHYSIFQGPATNQASLCMGLVCYLHGSKDMLDQLNADPSCDDRLKHVKVSPSPCLGYCHAAPVIALGDGTICKITDSN